VTQQVRLIVGLGNPGSEYDRTRHNAGADFVSELVRCNHTNLKPEKKFLGLHGKVQVDGKEVHCLIPTTFMNRSGQAIKAIAQFYKIPAEEILIAHDELDLPPGTVKLKQDGGHGGHNGLRDTVAHLGTKNFKRLRLGIGHPGDSKLVTNHVLKRASKSDQQLIDATIDECIRKLPEVVNGDWSKAMNLINGFKA